MSTSDTLGNAIAAVRSVLEQSTAVAQSLRDGNMTGTEAADVLLGISPPAVTEKNVAPRDSSLSSVDVSSMNSPFTSFLRAGVGGGSGGKDGRGLLSVLDAAIAFMSSLQTQASVVRTVSLRDGATPREVNSTSPTPPLPMGAGGASSKPQQHSIIGVPDDEVGQWLQEAFTTKKRTKQRSGLEAQQQEAVTVGQQANGRVSPHPFGSPATASSAASAGGRSGSAGGHRHVKGIGPRDAFGTSWSQSMTSSFASNQVPLQSPPSKTHAVSDGLPHPTAVSLAPLLKEGAVLDDAPPLVLQQPHVVNGRPPPAETSAAILEMASPHGEEKRDSNASLEGAFMKTTETMQFEPGEGDRGGESPAPSTGSRSASKGGDSALNSPLVGLVRVASSPAANQLVHQQSGGEKKDDDEEAMLHQRRESFKESKMAPSGSSARFNRKSRQDGSFGSFRRQSTAATLQFQLNRLLQRYGIPLLEVDDPDFDIFKEIEVHNCERNILLFMAANVFFRYPFFEVLDLDIETFIQFVCEVQRHYNPENPYHNQIHAADVLQTTHLYLCVEDVRDNFDEAELLSMLFSALIHDVGHLGTGNAFLVNIGHPVASVYNDLSPQESMHAALGFALLKQHNFFAKSKVWTARLHNEFRQTVVQSVTGTDMKHHANLISIVSEILADGQIDDDEISYLFKSIIHAADLSNPMKPAHIYRNWTHRILAEFWQQGDQEKLRGLDVSIMCDRENVCIPKAQTGFISYIVAPFIRELATLLPDVWVSRLDSNLTMMRNWVGEYDLSEIQQLAKQPWVDRWQRHSCMLSATATMRCPTGKLSFDDAHLGVEAKDYQETKAELLLESQCNQLLSEHIANLSVKLRTMSTATARRGSASPPALSTESSFGIQGLGGGRSDSLGSTASVPISPSRQSPSILSDNNSPSPQPLLGLLALSSTPHQWQQQRLEATSVFAINVWQLVVLIERLALSSRDDGRGREATSTSVPATSSNHEMSAHWREALPLLFTTTPTPSTGNSGDAPLPVVGESSPPVTSKGNAEPPPSSQPSGGDGGGGQGLTGLMAPPDALGGGRSPAVLAATLAPEDTGAAEVVGMNGAAATATTRDNTEHPILEDITSSGPTTGTGEGVGEGPSAEALSLLSSSSQRLSLSLTTMPLMSVESPLNLSAMAQAMRSRFGFGRKKNSVVSVCSSESEGVISSGGGGGGTGTGSAEIQPFDGLDGTCLANLHPAEQLTKAYELLSSLLAAGGGAGVGAGPTTSPRKSSETAVHPMSPLTGNTAATPPSPFTPAQALAGVVGGSIHSQNILRILRTVAQLWEMYCGVMFAPLIGSGTKRAPQPQPEGAGLVSVVDSAAGQAVGVPAGVVVQQRSPSPNSSPKGLMTDMTYTAHVACQTEVLIAEQEEEEEEEEEERDNNPLSDSNAAPGSATLTATATATPHEDGTVSTLLPDAEMGHGHAPLEVRLTVEPAAAPTSTNQKDATGFGTAPLHWRTLSPSLSSSGHGSVGATHGAHGGGVSSLNPLYIPPRGGKFNAGGGGGATAEGSIGIGSSSSLKGSSVPVTTQRSNSSLADATLTPLRGASSSWPSSTGSLAPMDRLLLPRGLDGSQSSGEESASPSTTPHKKKSSAPLRTQKEEDSGEVHHHHRRSTCTEDSASSVTTGGAPLSHRSHSALEMTPPLPPIATPPRSASAMFAKEEEEQRQEEGDEDTTETLPRGRRQGQKKTKKPKTTNASTSSSSVATVTPSTNTTAETNGTTPGSPTASTGSGNASPLLLQGPFQYMPYTLRRLKGSRRDSKGKIER